MSAARTDPGKPTQQRTGIGLLLTALAFATVLLSGTPIVLLALLILAGPHSDFLPGWATLPTAVVANAALLTLAVSVSRRAWRRLGRTKRAAGPSG